MFCGEGQGAAADSLKVLLLNQFRKKDFALHAYGPILNYLLHHLLSLFFSLHLCNGLFMFRSASPLSLPFVGGLGLFFTGLLISQVYCFVILSYGQIMPICRLLFGSRVF